MKMFNRRDFLQAAGYGSFALATFNPLTAMGKTSGHVIVIGGGFGGATCAKYLNRFDPNLMITLIEVGKNFTTCPFSNAVLGGMRDIKSITHGYAAQMKRGIHVVHARVTQVDAIAKKIMLDNGKQLSYDRLVMSPGIDFKWDKVEGIW